MMSDDDQAILWGIAENVTVTLLTGLFFIAMDVGHDPTETQEREVIAAARQLWKSVL